jgi:hypothetical protein
MPVKKDQDVYVMLGEDDREAVEAAKRNRGDAAPSHGTIARRAYERFLARGRSHGRDVEDWLAAERELRKD